MSDTRALSERDRTRFYGLRQAWEAGVRPALFAALDYSVKEKVDPPRWVVEAARELIKKFIPQEKGSKAGRTSSPSAQNRQDLIDYTRYDLVDLVRFTQRQIEREIQELRKCSASPERLAEALESQNKFGRSWDDAYRYVSKLIRTTGAFGSPEAIKRSYSTVKRNKTDPAKAARYHPFDKEVYRALGLDRIFMPKPVKKST